VTIGRTPAEHPPPRTAPRFPQRGFTVPVKCRAGPVRGGLGCVRTSCHYPIASISLPSTCITRRHASPLPTMSG
jgi:hypothetical protein